jgi:hypothetical protein
VDIGVGIGGGKSWFWTESITRGRNRSQGRSSDLSKNMVVDEIHFVIDADVQKCLLIAPRHTARNAVKKIFQACASGTEHKKSQETYYYVYQPIQASPLLDQAASLEERALMTLIRGQPRFQAFVKVLQDPNLSLNFIKNLAAPTDLLREAENRYDGYFPGLLTPTE